MKIMKNITLDKGKNISKSNRSKVWVLSGALVLKTHLPIGHVKS